MIVLLAGRFEVIFPDPLIYTHALIGDFCRVRR